MNPYVDFVVEKQMERTAEALRKNRMVPHCVSTVEEARALVRELIAPGSVVSNGHSTTLEETGILDMLQAGPYQFVSKKLPADATLEQRRMLLGTIMCADWFCASANAITENGEIYEVDGHASRVTPIAFGPTNVLIVAGYNKIVPDLDAAKSRLQHLVAPANAKRIGVKTPCVVTGVCQNCHSPERICCTTMILGNQRIADRVHVLLIKESLGY